jgi:putative FmdB family regulatory protein
MPIYVYKCPQNHTTEKVMRITEDSKVIPCPQCSEEAVKQIAQVAKAQFSGGGWTPQRLERK